jgi:two-component system, NtrC family, response regulator AtoC
MVSAHDVPSVGEVSLGRGADIVVSHDSISRQHLSLRFGPSVDVSDLGSTNETTLFGTPLSPHVWVPVQPGDLLVVGGEALVMLHDGEARSVPKRRSGQASLDELAKSVDRGVQIAICTRISTPNVNGQRPATASANKANWLNVLAGALLARDELIVLGDNEAALVLVDRTIEQAELAARTLEEHLLSIHAATTIRLGGQAPSSVDVVRRDARFADEVALRATMRRAWPVVRGPAMTTLYGLVDEVAPTRVNVLVLGETGVGKDVIARTLHERSPRARSPFVSLNCSAVPENLLESELFGYERGAFTGAVTAKPGLLETAEGGTVFLDEVGEMPLATQAKLLRVLEDRTVRRVGALKPNPIDVRVIAATNRDLPREISEGRFRADLFYRLNGLSLVIPPLRERRDEIGPLIAHFLASASETLGRPTPQLSDKARACLDGYAWPGNIRELRNVIERVVLLARGGTISAELLPPEIAGAHDDVGDDASDDVKINERGVPSNPDPSLEKAQIIDALARCSGNQTRAAQLLGITRRVLIKRIERYNLPRPRGSRAD